MKTLFAASLVALLTQPTLQKLPDVELRTTIAKFEAAWEAAPGEKREGKVGREVAAVLAIYRAEETFRADTVKPLCQADVIAWSMRESIKREKANPAGVVDLEALHKWGQALQFAEGTMAALRPGYAKVRKHAWKGYSSEATCAEFVSE